MFGSFPRRLILAVLLVLLLAGVLSTATAQPTSPQAVENIILFIGDGMGPQQIGLARYYSLFVLGKELNMTKVMNLGSTAFMTNYSLNYVVTDSAAAATALATGYKTNNGMIGMTPEGIPRITILEKAQELGKRVGLVTTTRLTHATPAAFAAHIDSRSKENEIAVQMLEHKVDVLLGGGRRHFIPQSVKGSKRKDDLNLLAEAEKMGYTVVENAEEFRAVNPILTKRLLGLFKSSHMSYELDRDPAKEPSLAEMTEKAIQILSLGRKGFFLMVEGGRIDHASHVSDAAGTIHETLAFDEAIGVALKFAADHPNTLIIVTADHETGGLAMTKGLNPEGKLDYTTVQDLREISQIKATFGGVINRAVEEAKDLDEIKAVIKEYTGIEITDEEAQMIMDQDVGVPTFFAQPGNAIGRALQDEITVGWATGNHTATPLFLFAVGPYSERFTGFLDNTDVPKIMSAAFRTGY